MLNSIAILGRPNVGKSSLFNKLTKTRNAIVSDFSGLTKDRNFGYASIKDQQYLVVDTGGVGSEITEFSAAITEQALIAAEDSNLILFLIDASEELTADDIDLFQSIRKMNKSFFVVLNKIDIKKRSNAKEDLLKLGCGDILEISAEHSKGIKELQTYISKQFIESNAGHSEDPQGTKIAVIGRPNAGKSTFINQFTKQDRLIVSDVPGTTIDSIHVPFVFDDEDFIFIDTAGIRKKYKQSHAVEYFSYVRAMHAVDESDIVLMLIDASDRIVDQDLRILNLIRGYGKPVVVALNKIDELSEDHLYDLKETKKFQNSVLNNLILVEISALQKRGFKKLFNTLAKVNKLVGKQEFEYKINKNLSFTNRLSYNYASVDNKTFSPLAWYGAGKYANSAINANLDPVQVEIAEDVFIERGASVFEQRATYLDLNFESFLNYSRTIDDHNIKATLGTSVFSRRGDVLNGTAFNIPNNSLDFADISANMAQNGYLNNTGSYEFEERLLSNFLRAEYGFQYKYIFSAILRRDGSSKFGPNSRFGYFPSVSGAWIVSDEDFFNVGAISFFKIRTSYGVSGNDQIANFAYRALLNGEGVYVFNDIITPGVAIGTAANPDLKWETTRQLNLGVDLQLLNLFDISANYFIKNTNDLLFSPDVSAIIGSYGPGGYPPIINAGDVSNKGFEFEFAYATDVKKNIGMNVNFNFTYIENEVKSVPSGVEFLPGSSFGVGGNTATRFEVGFPIGYFIGYQTDGIFQTQEEIDNSTVYQPGAQVGDFRFVDIDGDGEINFSNNTDKTNLGSPIPKFMFGSVLGFNVFGLDISANLYAALGHKIVRNYERQQPYANQLDYVLDRWTIDNPSNDVPLVTTSINRNGVFSDFYVEDGSYLRLRNIQIGYVLPKKICEKFGTDFVRFYVAANNLFTITNYMGYDPDIGATQGTLSGGMDYGFYPQAKTIMGGVNIKF